MAHRIALIGAGTFGQKHLAVIAAEPGFALAGLADPSLAARALAEERCVPWFAEPAALLDAVKPDGAIIVTPNRLHVPHALLCIERGIPVLVEKPVADTPEAAEALALAAEAAGTPVLVGQHRRHNPILQAAHATIAGGRLGDLIAVNLTWLIHKPDAYFDLAWRREPGGGPIMINLVHELDALRFVVGEIAAVRAITSNTTRGFAVEDTVAIAVRFTNGALGTILVSDATPAPWNWEMTSGENPAYVQQHAVSGVIAGRLASLSLPYLDLWQHRPAPGQDTGWMSPIASERVPVRHDDAYQRQLRHFGAVIDGAAPLVTVRDAARTLAWCLAVHDSARTGQEVALAG